MEIGTKRVDQGTLVDSTVTVKIDLSDQTNSNSVTLREAAVRAIFTNNIRRMNECTHMYANFQNNDVGTVFEVGYFIAEDLYHLTLNRLLIQALEAKAIDLGENVPQRAYAFQKLELESEVTRTIKNITNKLEVFYDEGNVVQKILTDPNYFINVLDSFGVESTDGQGVTYSTPSSFEWTGESAERYEVERAIQKFFTDDVRFIKTDDFPVANMLALGMFAKLGTPIVTYSEAGHGSNVMLATCSTHYNTKSKLDKAVYENAIFDANSGLLDFTSHFKAKVAYGAFDFTQEID